MDVGRKDREEEMYQIYGEGKARFWVVSTPCDIKKIKKSILELHSWNLYKGINQCCPQ